MALAALIAAYHESGEPGHLRATLPLAGRTVIERQARLAAAAGARRSSSSSSACPPRCPPRSSACAATASRSSSCAAPRKRPRRSTLMTVSCWSATAPSPAARSSPASPPPKAPAVLTVPDGSHGELYERIDAGLALGGHRRDRRRVAARDRRHAARLGFAIDPAAPHPPGGRAPSRRRGRGRDPRPRRGSRPARAPHRRRRRRGAGQLVGPPARADRAARHRLS